MIPESIATLLAFLTLVAPGIVYQMVIERRLPSTKESAFREASVVALASLVFTLAALIILTLLRTVVPAAILDISLWVRQGNQYLADSLLIVAASLALQVIIACGFAAGAALLQTSKSQALISREGAWYKVFLKDRPPGTRPWVHLRLKDKTEFWGELRYYTPEDDAESREIVLGGSALKRRRDTETEASLIGDQWDAICVNGDDISFIGVIYLDTNTGELYGRPSPSAPKGALRPPTSI